MNIDVTRIDATPVAEQDTRPRRWRITVEIDSETDDPAGHLWALMRAERLDSFFRLYGQGHELPIGGDGDLWGLMVDAGRIGGRLASVTDLLLWRARDTYGRSWGQIAQATELGMKAIRSSVERTRREMAARGYWRDEEGLHYDDRHADDPGFALFKAELRESELARRRTMRER